jgi:hypothetical protein
MRGIVFSMSLLLAAYCGPGMAAAPVFQLDGQPAAGSASAVYGYHPETEAAASASAIAEMETVRPVAAAQPDIFAARTGRAWPAAGLVPVAFSNSPRQEQVQAPRKMASGMKASDDLLFYFLRDFKAKQPQKPARWAMLLIALSLLLYQIRRRPMRTSIGFGSASRLGGQHAA